MSESDDPASMCGAYGQDSVKGRPVQKWPFMGISCLPCLGWHIWARAYVYDCTGPGNVALGGTRLVSNRVSADGNLVIEVEVRVSAVLLSWSR